jgi:hypothetical protein
MAKKHTRRQKRRATHRRSQRGGQGLIDTVSKLIAELATFDKNTPVVINDDTPIDYVQSDGGKVHILGRGEMPY